MIEFWTALQMNDLAIQFSTEAWTQTKNQV